LVFTKPIEILLASQINAREKLRVAHCLQRLHQINKAFEDIMRQQAKNASAGAPKEARMAEAEQGNDSEGASKGALKIKRFT
jgi:hypothetical protein